MLPPWLPTLLSGLCVALFSWMLARQGRRDDRVELLERCVQDIRLEMAKEYFSVDSAKDLIGKMDEVIKELHAQNITLARVEAELKAARQTAAIQSTQHHNPQ